MLRFLGSGHKQSTFIGSLVRPFVCFERIINLHSSQMHDGETSKRHVVSTLELAIVAIGLRRSSIRELDSHEAVT
jgi:hypothetical protein